MSIVKVVSKFLKYSRYKLDLNLKRSWGNIHDSWFFETALPIRYYLN